VVIDVRSGRIHCPASSQAVNIPLSEIETVIGRKVKDKNQVVLLHCQSGRRALEARRRLKALVTQTRLTSDRTTALRRL